MTVVHWLVYLKTYILLPCFLFSHKLLSFPLSPVHKFSYSFLSLLLKSQPSFTVGFHFIFTASNVLPSFTSQMLTSLSDALL